MKRLIALMMCAVSLGAAAQITYPYNPDGNADALIGVIDLQDLLSTYGGAFSPSEIQIDGVGLAEVIGQLQATVEAQQAYITQLQQYISITDNTVIISGANLQVVSGEGSTDASVNGAGNIIIGYDEDTSDDKSGSHNLVIGKGHTYSSFGGMVVGYNNSITGGFSSVSGGYGNMASGFLSSVSGGNSNNSSGEASSVLGGHTNITTTAFSSVSGGFENTASGNYSSVSGGKYNTASGNYSSVSGGEYNVAFLTHSSASGQYDIND